MTFELYRLGFFRKKEPPRWEERAAVLPEELLSR
jgi:hypothetical protein